MRNCGIAVLQFLTKASSETTIFESLSMQLMFPWVLSLDNKLSSSIWARIKDRFYSEQPWKKGKVNTHACLIWMCINGQTPMKLMVFPLIQQSPVHLAHLGVGVARIFATFVLQLFSTGNIVKLVFFRFCPIV
jgi:hypothetical protein